MLTINFGDDAIQRLIATASTNEQLVDADGNPVVVAAPIPDTSQDNESVADGEPFYIEFIPEGVETDDRRFFEFNSLEMRELPIPLLYQPKTQPGHGESVQVGAITNVWRVGNMVVGTGNFFEAEEGTELAGYVADAVTTVGQGGQRVSADLVDVEYYIVWGEDDEGFETVERQVFTQGKIAGATIVAVSAFDTGASIQLGDAPEPEDALVASGAYPEGFEAAFSMPEHDEPMPLTVQTLDNGLKQIYGYVALWDTCHVGRTSCVTAPHSKTSYAHFQTGLHQDTPVGVLTMDTGHAKIRLNLENSTKHYDNTGSVAAYIQTHETELGIAFCGYVEPSLDDSGIRRLSACGVSGDWRYDTKVGNLELCAVLAVPTPGFSTPRAFEQEPGRQLSLVAAGSYCRPCNETESVDEILNAYFASEPDVQQQIDELLDRIA